MHWTGQADNLLRKLLATGRSMTEIAAALAEEGYNVTRGMIAGRKHRIMLTERAMPQKPATPKPAAPKPPKSAAKWCGINYMDNDFGCKAILDQRGTDGLPMCCGLPRTERIQGGDSSYCAAHHAAYNYVSQSRTSGRW